MCVLIFWTALRGSQNSSVTLSQVMNHGFWSTTPRQNAKVGSGTLQTLPVPRKREWANPKSNRCSFVFLTVRGSSTRNLCHQDKLSIKLFIRKSLKDSGKGWHMCDRALNALGCCTTTTPHVTWQSPSINYWQNKTFLRFLSPAIRRISVPVTSFYSSGSKTTWKWCHFGTLDNIQKSVTDELKGIPAEVFQHCYEQWKQRLHHCVAAQGNYFEGDNPDL